MSSMRSSISNSRHQIALVLVSLGTFGIYQISYFWLVQIVLNFLYILDETAASRVVCCEACLHWHRGGHDSTSKDHQTAFHQFHYIWKDTVEKSQQASSKVNLLFCSVLTRLNEQVFFFAWASARHFLSFSHSLSSPVGQNMLFWNSERKYLGPPIYPIPTPILTRGWRALSPVSIWTWTLDHFLLNFDVGTWRRTDVWHSFGPFVHFFVLQQLLPSNFHDSQQYIYL